MVIVLVLLVLTACGLLGAWIAGEKRRRPEEGLVIGFLFGPLGCLIVALLPVGDHQPPEPPKTSPEDWRRRELERREARERQEAARLLREHLAKQAEAARKERAAARMEWFRRVVLRFGWFRALPEIAQPIVLGLAVAAPIVVLIALALR